MRDTNRRLAPATLTMLLAAAALAAPAMAQRPDDRAGPLGVGAISYPAASAERPDNRGGLLGIGSIAGAVSAVPLRPDDRAGLRGPMLGTTSAAVAAAQAARVTTTNDGIAWRDAFFGAGATLIVVLLAGVLMLTLRGRRRVITP
jgi:hypothetical protein